MMSINPQPPTEPVAAQNNMAKWLLFVGLGLIGAAVVIMIGLDQPDTPTLLPFTEHTLVEAQQRLGLAPVDKWSVYQIENMLVYVPQRMERTTDDEIDSVWQNVDAVVPAENKPLAVPGPLLFMKDRYSPLVNIVIAPIDGKQNITPAEAIQSMNQIAGVIGAKRIQLTHYQMGARDVSRAIFEFPADTLTGYSVAYVFSDGQRLWNIVGTVITADNFENWLPVFEEIAKRVEL